MILKGKSNFDQTGHYIIMPWLEDLVRKRGKKTIKTPIDDIIMIGTEHHNLWRNRKKQGRHEKNKNKKLRETQTSEDEWKHISEDERQSTD